jgi:hypothetical protein
LALELPRVSETSPITADNADASPEEVRLFHGEHDLLAPPPRLDPPPQAATEAALSALVATASQLRSDPGLNAVAALDHAGRQALEPRLRAVRDMANTISELMQMRSNATAKLRSQGRA